MRIVDPLILLTLSLSTELDRLREEGLEPELDAQVLEFWFTLRDFLNTADLLDENYVIYSEIGRKWKLLSEALLCGDCGKHPGLSR